MRSPFPAAILSISVGIAIIAAPPRCARAQEAEIVTTIGKDVVEALGKNAAEFGGETAVRQTVGRLLAEAAETGGGAEARIAAAQVRRIIACGNESIIFDLKSISGKSLPLLEGLPEGALPSAVGTLARPAVREGIGSIGSATLRKAALGGEMRLPGAGLKLVKQYGEEGAALAQTLTEDQANSVIAAMRPSAVNVLPRAERTSLLNALASRADARVFHLSGATGPLLVVAGGVVIWHGIDVVCAPNETVIERPDGTVIRERKSIGSQAVQMMPSVARELSDATKWTGITLAAGIALAASLFLRRRHKMLGHGAA